MKFRVKVIIFQTEVEAKDKQEAVANANILMYKTIGVEPSRYYTYETEEAKEPIGLTGPLHHTPSSDVKPTN